MRATPFPSTPQSPYRRILDMACDAQMGYRMPVDVRNAIIGDLDQADLEATELPVAEVGEAS